MQDFNRSTGTNRFPSGALGALCFQFLREVLGCTVLLYKHSTRTSKWSTRTYGIPRGSSEQSGFHAEHLEHWVSKWVLGYTVLQAEHQGTFEIPSRALGHMGFQAEHWDIRGSKLGTRTYGIPSGAQEHMGFQGENRFPSRAKRPFDVQQVNLVPQNQEKNTKTLFLRIPFYHS